MVRNNRTAGHNYERWEARGLRDSGLFPTAVTTRSSSKQRDNEKVDLMNADELDNGRMEYNIQCKSSCKYIKYHDELKSMPHKKGITNVVLHRYTVPSASKKFIVKGTYAILKRNDFYEMMRLRRGFEIMREYMDKIDERTRAEIQTKLSKIGL